MLGDFRIQSFCTTDVLAESIVGEEDALLRVQREHGVRPVEERGLDKCERLFAKVQGLTGVYVMEHCTGKGREMPEESFLGNFRTVDRRLRVLFMDLDKRSRVILLDMVLDNDVDLLLSSLFLKCIGNAGPHLGRVSRVHVVDECGLLTKDQVTVVGRSIECISVVGAEVPVQGSDPVHAVSNLVGFCFHGNHFVRNNTNVLLYANNL